MKTGSSSQARRSPGKANEWAGPLYLDASALVKIYLPEAGSQELDYALLGRRDLIVSDLAVTEIISALARRRREGAINPQAVARLHRAILADIDSGLFHRVDLLPAIHREAERLLLFLQKTPVRAADALHLALATASNAASIATFDKRMTEGARYLGFNAVP